MAETRVTYSFCGGNNETTFPNIEGSSLSVNMFSEANGSGEDVRYFMQSCPGIKFIKELGSIGKCDGLFVPSTGLKSQSYQQCLFCAYNGSIYRITPRSLTQEIIGTYALGNRVEFAESGGERAILLWVDGQNIGGYSLKDGKSVSIKLPKRLNENAYIQPSHIAVVSGSIVLNDIGSSYVFYTIPYPLNTETRQVFNIVNGQVQYGANNEILMTPVDSGDYCFLDDYGTRQYFNAASSSDKCIAISSVGALLTLFGPSSIEFWQRGDSESYQTWQRTSYTINKEQGLEAPYSLASVNHQQFCIGTGKANSKCVLMITDTKVEKISPLWLDKILNKSEVSRIIGWTYSLNNHSFYLFSIGDKCYAYDLTTGEWHIRTSRNFYNGKNKNYMPLYAVWWDNMIVTGCCENGNLFELNPEYFYEDFDGQGHKLPLLRVRQTPVITSNYKPFSIYELSLECNIGCKETYGEPGFALLEMSSDGGYTFGNVRRASIGRRGEYNARLKWMNLGRTRQCVLKLTYSEPTDFVISDASIRFSELNTGV